MKVLITGGCGLIGTHLSKRLKKEGHDIFIVDDLANGRVNHIKVAHKIYKVSTKDSTCESIFAGNSFDAVIYLTDVIHSVDSINSSELSLSGNIVGLVNMLQLSSRYNVKKFVYVSSVEASFEASGIQGLSNSYGVSKKVGELYCQYWNAKYHLDTVALRVSKIYGPVLEEHSQSRINKLIYNLKIGNHHDTYEYERTHEDFLYVDDAVDAIYKAISFSNEQIINITSGEYVNIREILSILEKDFGMELDLPDIDEFDEKEKTQNIHDNELAVKDLNWTPRFSLEEGIHKTFNGFDNKAMSELAPKTEKKVIKTPSFVLKIYRKILPYLENLGVFAGAVIIDKIQFQYESAIRLDFLLIYIILIGIHYGLSQASVAVALSIGYLIFNLTGDGKNVISVLYDVNALIQINLYVFIGSVLGYGIDSKNYKIKETNNEKEKIEEKFDFLHTLYEESKIIRRELQDQIIGSEDSFRKIYDITSRLDSLKPEAIYDEAVGVIETVMKSTNVAIYMVSGDKYFLRLVAKSKKSDVEIIKSIRTETYKPAQEIFESRKMFVNSKLENGFPMLAMPITHGEDVVAIVAIFKMDFEFMSHYRQNLLITLASLITTALRKAYQYDHVIHEQKYMMDTMVLNASHFEDIHLLKQKAKDVNETDFVVLKIHEIDWYDKGDHLIAEKILREMDFLGVNEEGDLLILLPNTTNEEAGFVMKRFREKGIENIALVEEASDVEVDTDHTSTN